MNKHNNNLSLSYVSKVNEKAEKKNLIDVPNSNDALISILPTKLKMFNLFELAFAYSSLFVLNHPNMSCLTAIVNLVAITFMINSHVRDATDVTKIIDHDYSGIRSKYDLHLGTIDHWCLGVSNFIK